MKFKIRFKKALFAFFKDEILKSVGADVENKVEVRNVKYNLIEISTQILLDEKISAMPSMIVYEEALEKARQELFEKIMNYVIIDNHSVMDQYIYPHRKIRISLLLGIK